MALVLGLTLSLAATNSLADDPAPAAPPAANDDEAKTVPPEEVELATDDGVALKLTYFPGTKGKESIPVVLLHGAKGNRKDFTEDQGLAPILQEKLGCAVIVPDLRGHGESTKITIGNRVEKLDGNKLRPAQFSAMVSQDMRAVKAFLWKKNNAEALNINKLAVVGVDMGAAVALGYAADDAHGYEQGQCRVGPLQLGEFVKAVVFISPSTDVNGLSLPPVMRLAPEIFQNLSVLTLVGNKDKKKFTEAQKLSNLFEKARKPEGSLKIGEKTVLFLPKIATQLQGPKLLAEPSLEMPKKIESFLTMRLVDNPKAKEEWKWKKVKLPHED